MPSPSTRFISTSAVAIHYHQYGNPNGQPIFLLHGFPDSPVAWLPVIDHLDRKKFRLIVPYLRGFGPTVVRLPEHISGEPAALASDLLTLADHLGIERFHVVGHDWGATAANSTAVLAPERVRSLVTLASPYAVFAGKTLPPQQVQDHWYQWYFNTRPGVEDFSSNPIPFSRSLWSAWSPKWKFTEKEYTEAALAFTNPQHTAIVLHCYRNRHETDPGREPYAAAAAILKPKPAISVPTLFVHGTADSCNMPESSVDLKSKFTGPYQRVLLKNLGHFPHREDPKAIAKLISRHLKKHP